MSADTSLTIRIRKALSGIAGDFDATLTPARRLIETHAVSSLVNPPLPVSAATLDARAKACATLDHWYMAVRTARKLKAGIDRWDVPRLTAFLTVHAAWLAESVDGPKACHQLEKVGDKLAEIAQDAAPRRFDVSDCPVIDCPGVLRVTLRNTDALLPSEIRCTLDPDHKWSPSQWKYIA